MSCNYYRFLLVRTYKDGAAEIVATTDSEEEIMHLFMQHRTYEQPDFFRYDIYKIN